MHHNFSITAGTYTSYVCILHAMRTILSISLLLSCVSWINFMCCVHMYMQHFPSVYQVLDHCLQLQAASHAVLNSYQSCPWECGGHCHLSQEGGEQVTLFTSQWTRLYVHSACLGGGVCYTQHTNIGHHAVENQAGPWFNYAFVWQL